MEINKRLYQSLVDCKWFENCGVMDNCTYDFEVYIVKTEKELMKSIQSIAWENTCLEAQGDLSEYLHIYHRKEFDEYWNKEVDIIKETYYPPISDKIEKIIEEKNYPLEIKADLDYTILLILMADYYSEFYESVFFKNLLEIYLSGHLPCGWKGKYPDGKIMVF